MQRAAIGAKGDGDAWPEIYRLYLRIGGRRLQKAVRLARRGEVDPDPETVALCLQWARLVLSSQRRYEALDAGVARRVGAFLLEMATLGFVDYFNAWARERSMVRDATLIADAFTDQG